jgi:FtsP/CotA-like multicopper oxidase with cupredoxin domain
MKPHQTKCLQFTLFGLLALMLVQSLAAQKIPCPPPNPDLVPIPELVSKDGKLQGTLVVTAQQQSIASRIPPSAPETTSTFECYPQLVRVMNGTGALPAAPVTPAGTYPLPLPGPTLRVRVGELVELTLLNQIDAGRFPNSSIDRGDSAEGGCDQTPVYPGPTTGPHDTYPDCFHGSSTINMHFHGTHTNPNSTGDNVFIELRPSMRTKDQANKPIVTAASVKKPFKEFFEHCEAKLTPAKVLSQWPRTWKDLPEEYTKEQKRLLKIYDLTPGVKKLWPVDKAQLEKQDWPQYYMGAYPYCFRLPEYTETTWPPADNPPTTGGAGTAEHAEMGMEHPLKMGQAPGTHWYHAHKHGSTAIDVANGMTGAIIIEGGYDDYFNTQYGAGWTRKQPVMVINQIGTATNLERGGGTATGTPRPQWQGQDKGPDFSVNGRIQPVVKMYPGEVQMWRIVNSSGRAGTFFVGPPAGGFEWKQLAQDGVQFNDDNYNARWNKNASFLLMPGNRADLLVKAPTTLTAGATLYPVLVQNEVDPSDRPTAAKIPLIEIRIDGSGTAMNFPDHTAPFPPFLQDIAASEVTGTKQIVFASTGPPFATHTIDGKKFDGEVGEVVLLNTVEEWTVVNKTYSPAISHPFHIHINPFQVTEVFDPNRQLRSGSGSGTVSTTKGSATVTGTSFTTQLHVGDLITISGQRTAAVLAIASDTSLTISANASATAAGATYTYVVPYYTSSKTPQTGQCVINALDPSSFKPCDATAPKDRIWWDVFPIPAGNPNVVVANADGTTKTVQVPGQFKMRSRFVDFSGYYVIHCHILAHEDRGMMTIVEVAPLRSPYSHH